MKRFKKILRVLGYTVFLALAASGMGLGAIVLPKPQRKEDTIEIAIDTRKANDEDQETTVFKLEQEKL